MTESTLSPNEWTTFVQQQATPSTAGANRMDFVAPLTSLGLLAFSGEEAAAFLHNQLTNDVEHLDAGEVHLAHSSALSRGCGDAGNASSGRSSSR